MKGSYCLSVIVLLFLYSGQQAADAAETARRFQDGIQYYKEDRFPEAAAAFLDVVRTGVKNGSLFYDLGNAYLKSGHVGEAILWYERALKLIPLDPDLKFNYEYAVSLTRDEKGEKEFPLIRILFFWKYLLQPSWIQGAAIGFNLIYWGLMAVRIIRKKTYGRTAGHLVLIVGLVFILTAVFNEYDSVMVREAVILPDKVSVRSGLADDSTELFVLHAGAKVKVDKEKDQYFRIFFSDGKIGWVKRSDAGLI